MCQGHRCIGCGSQLVYRHQLGGSCYNISYDHGLGGSSCRSRSIRCCPLCDLNLWQSNLFAFVYGRSGEGWVEVTPGWGVLNVPPQDQVRALDSQRANEARARWAGIRVPAQMQSNPVLALVVSCGCQACAY